MPLLLALLFLFCGTCDGGKSSFGGSEYFGGRLLFWRERVFPTAEDRRFAGGRRRAGVVDARWLLGETLNEGECCDDG